MVELDERLSALDPRHRAALEWFRDRAGNIESWPDQLPDGTYLASHAKGIYKPSWSTAALSVRQNLDGPYADRDPINRPDGTWSYMYFQENPDPTERDNVYTNRGLMRCHADRVPVGVFRQIQRKPTSRYRVLGLAMVAGWEEGYFFLEGFSSTGQANNNGPAALIDDLLRNAEAVGPSFDPADLMDGRERAIASVVRRRGQPAFRKVLIEAYGGRCAVTGCDAVEALEAAHIVPYRGPETNHVTNGILLRSDLHTLFDLGMVAIDTTSMTLVLDPRIANSSYMEFSGTLIRVPDIVAEHPSDALLDYHRLWSGL